MLEAQRGTPETSMGGSRSMMFGRDPICGVVAARTARQAVRQLTLALRRTRTVELRLDYLASDKECRALLRALPHLAHHGVLLATCRRTANGGRFSGDIRRQIPLLAAAAAAGCAWCDVEIETAAKFRGDVLRSLLRPARLLISYHDFRRTPRDLRSVFKRLGAARADAVKIATHCRNLGDSLRVLRVARGRRNVIAVPMGEAALPARVLALREGSALAYAAVEEATAPGQLSLEEMTTLYRAASLDRRTRIYGVIGDPVGHSLSPLLHNTGFRLRRINAVYLPFLVRELRDFLAIVAPLGVAGFSVTLPYKQRILGHLDECDPLAASIGAVNTVVRRGRKLCGYNTDYVGVLRALERRMTLRGSRILLFGAGGAARAVAFALAQADAEVIVCARKLEQARHLARAVGGEAILRRHLQSARFDAIVNATPVGMHPRTGASPLTSSELRCRLVFDLVYRPMRTRLLELAARRGIETVSGAEMFIAQGIAQWEMWTEQRAPEAAMRRTVLAALAREERAGARGKP
jgi:3-dehydroquinate dehydratase/shikimate dehydrogenase